MFGRIAFKGGLAIAALALFAVPSQAQDTRTSNFKCSMLAPNFTDGTATLQFFAGATPVGAKDATSTDPRTWSCSIAMPQEDGTIFQPGTADNWSATITLCSGGVEPGCVGGIFASQTFTGSFTAGGNPRVSATLDVNGVAKAVLKSGRVVH